MPSDKEREEWILAVHPVARVRGALHRSLGVSERFSVFLCSGLAQAQLQVSRKMPAVVLMRFGEAFEWGLSLYTRQLVPVVFCFVKGQDMSRSSDARALGLVHFVELPGDRPASWARESERLLATMESAIELNKIRREKFARATSVQPILSDALRASMSPEFCPDLGSAMRDSSGQAKPGQTVVLEAITRSELVASCADDVVSSGEQGASCRKPDIEPGHKQKKILSKKCKAAEG